MGTARWDDGLFLRGAGRVVPVLTGSCGLGQAVFTSPEGGRAAHQLGSVISVPVALWRPLRGQGELRVRRCWDERGEQAERRARGGGPCGPG